MVHGRLESLSYSQRERLAFIEFRLMFMGEVRRAELSARFDVATAAGTRDLALYRELAADNVAFDLASKIYKRGPKFVPIFEHAIDRALTALSQGFGDGVGGQLRPMLPFEGPALLNRPAIEIVAAVCRAIYQRQPVSIEYSSMDSGIGWREIVPFALVDSGLRWHVRAFDRKRQDFRDFVLTRITSTDGPKNLEVAPHERPDQDVQWNRIVELEMSPHPNREHPEVIAMDFGMVNQVLKVKCRAAVAGYLLRRWYVDCSKDRTITDEACYLFLRDPLVLYGVGSATLAPAYQSPNVDDGNR